MCSFRKTDGQRQTKVKSICERAFSIKTSYFKTCAMVLIAVQLYLGNDNDNDDNDEQYSDRWIER